jgi:RND family efflux transporter MFP subunit
VLAIGILIAICGVHANAQTRTGTPIFEGFTQPRFEVMVAATEIGLIDAVHVDVGDTVEAGQVIAELENSLQESAVRIAQQQSNMHGELDATRAEAEMNRNRTATIRELAAKRMARPDELVRAETDLRIAESREVAAVEQQRLRHLELDRYRLQLSRRQVLAPTAGVISQVFHHPGEYLTPGDPAVVELLVIDELLAVFNVPAEDAVGLEIGDPVSVSLRSVSKNFEAKLTTISPQIDGESGTVQVRVSLDNRDGKLRSGDRCTLQIRRKGTSSGVSPRQAFQVVPSVRNSEGRRE